jgi:asparagine synthetase B (glutamine-hydrolysing)
LSPGWDDLPSARAWRVRLGPRESGLIVQSESDPGQHARSESREVVFHGFLFNRAELSRRPELEGLRIENDAELLLNLYVRLGPAIFSELRGVFALVLWDARDRTLVATRDPLGMHPLFYAHVGSELVLSWSIEALLCAGASRDVNRVFVAEHLLHRWRALDETYFSSIRRVPAGHYLSKTDEVRLERYWQPQPEVSPEPRELEWWLDALESRLEQAVDRCLGLGRAGIYLSGGVDSTSVAVAAARVSSRRTLDPPLALSVSFPDEAANEAHAQDRVARALGLQRVTCSAEATPPNGLGLVESTLAAIAERAAPVGAVWDHAYAVLGEQARRHGCRVLLDGEGGDEWFTVPPVYAADLLRRLEFRRLGRFLKGSTEDGGRLPPRAIAAAAWRSAARPLLHRSVTKRAASVAPGLHDRYRRRRHALPAWISHDPGLRSALSERLDAPTPALKSLSAEAREATAWHPLVSMHLEDSFATGQRLGLPLLHPLWDVDLVHLLYSAPAGVLQAGERPKGLAIGLARRRLSIGEEWPKRATADTFLDRTLGAGLLPAWCSLGGPKTLENAGIIEPGVADAMIEESRRGNPLPLRDLWAMVKSEVWLRSRSRN